MLVGSISHGTSTARRRQGASSRERERGGRGMHSDLEGRVCVARELVPRNLVRVRGLEVLQCSHVLLRVLAREIRVRICAPRSSARAPHPAHSRNLTFTSLPSTYPPPPPATPGCAAALSKNTGGSETGGRAGSLTSAGLFPGIGPCRLAGVGCTHGQQQEQRKRPPQHFRDDSSPKVDRGVHSATS